MLFKTKKLIYFYNDLHTKNKDAWAEKKNKKKKSFNTGFKKVL